MARIHDDESRESRMRALLHGFAIKDDGTISSRPGTRSHDHLQRMKDRRARRGH